MADGADIPYQLRPNKFIDRQVFLELLTKVTGAQRHGAYVYASMGGKHLIDQEAVYRKVGIENLFSFDSEEWVVDRQNKNRPHDMTICQVMTSGAFPSGVEDLLEAYQPATNFIAWLDYTRPRERLSQLQELSQLLQRCQPGDLVRITMNSEPRTLRGDWVHEGFAGPGEYRAHRLRSQLGAFFPSTVSSVSKDELQIILINAVELAAAEAANVSANSFVPVLLSSYADGQRMVTAAILTLDDSNNLPPALVDWEFLPASWSDILDISAPDLSMKEKLFIDQCLGKAPDEIIEEVGFRPAEDLAEAGKAIASYKRLHRYYPTFFAIGVQ